MEKLLYNKEAREELKKGIDILTNAVKVTLGPKGRNVIICDVDGPHPTKDGVTVARSINLTGAPMIGAEMLKIAAAKTAEIAGDGTSTTAILAQELISKCDKILATGVNPIYIKKGMEMGLLTATLHINGEAHEVDMEKDLESIATVSANNDSIIGKLVAQAYTAVGSNGIVNAEINPYGSTTTLKVEEGVQFNKGYYSPHFIDDKENMNTILEKPLIYITENKINNFDDIRDLVEQSLKENISLLIIAEDFAPEIISTLSLNFVRSGLRVLPIKAPGFGELKISYLADLNLITGTDTHISINTTNYHLGKADRVVINQNSTTIIGGKGNKEVINAKVEEIKSNIKDNPFNEKRELERIARLTGGVATINVGGNSELEAKEIKDRVDDAVAAVKAAISEGIVEGGGKVFYDLYNGGRFVLENKEIEMGHRLVMDSLKVPLEQICINAGVDPVTVFAKMEGTKLGYDALNDVFIDLVDHNIIDPAMVLRVSLENAVSIAITFLTTECIIFEE